MSSLEQTYPEHPEDVLTQWLTWHAAGGAALVIVTGTEGGAVRSPGALMAVSSSGAIAGYISGGCIDADVALQAENALRDGKPRRLRYGAGSPFTDLPLPCGGSIDVAILPQADAAALKTVRDSLAARQPAQLALEEAGGLVADYVPKLRVRIAGRGADCLALARVSRAAGISTHLQLRDGEDVSAAEAEGLGPVTPLETPADIPPADDDPWTAFVLMFHDRDWEGPLLKQALDGPAFYMGAVGSRRTHARRCEDLQKSGAAAVQIRRVRGPIGTIASMRDASMLAVSVLSEIVGAYHDRIRHPFGDVALVLLAAGRSERFEAGDKLLAPLDGAPVLSHAAQLLPDEAVAARLAVVGPDDAKRAGRLEEAGWQPVHNLDAAKGQSTSLAAGIEAVMQTGAEAALILLADMPHVTHAHLRALVAEYRLGHSAVMSEASGVLCPPAIFDETAFEALRRLDGDTGAKAIFGALPRTSTVAMPSDEALDIDTQSDLDRAERLAHA